MEAAPNIERLEELPQPDLLELYGDTEVTVFGVTGTFKDLADMCPVDLSDPRVSLEAKNTFVAKAANAAGLEVSKDHEEAFDRILKKHNVERKFTVAESQQPPTREAAERGVVVERMPTPAKPIGQPMSPVRKVPEAAVAAAYHEADRREPPQLAVATEKVERPMSPLGERLMRDTFVLHEHEAARRQEVGLVEIALRPRVNESPNKVQAEHMQIPLRRVEYAKPDVENALTEDNEHLHSAILPAPDETYLSTRLSEAAHDLDEFWADLMHDLAAIDGVDGNEEMPIALTVPEGVWSVEASPLEADDELSAENSTVVVDWNAELAKDADDVYEDFTRALNIFTELAAETDRPTANAEGTVEASEQPVGDHICLQVTERLNELSASDREVAAEVVKDIAGAIHGIHVLEARNADDERIGAVHDQLVELVVELFEAIGIEPEPQTVESFVVLLLRPEFAEEIATQEQVDLEHDGTHEAKRQFTHFMQDLSDSRHKLCQVLGMSVLAVLL